MTEERKQTDKTETVEITPIIGGISVEYADNVGFQEKEPAQETKGLEHVISLDPHSISLEELSTQETPETPQRTMSEMELFFGNDIKLDGSGDYKIKAGDLDLSGVVIEDMKYPKLNQEQITILQQTMKELKPRIDIMEKGAKSLETCGEIHKEWTRIGEDFFLYDKLRSMEELEIRIAKVGLMSINFSDNGSGGIKDLLIFIEKTNEMISAAYKSIIPKPEDQKEQDKKSTDKPTPREFRRAYL